MEQEEVTSVFYALFTGRTDAYGTEQGGCIHTEPDWAVWTDHLYGSNPIGIYPVLKNNTCTWSCIDIDKDDLPAAEAVGHVYRHFAMQPWIERSRSKGWHIWVFHSQPISCRTARDAGRAALLFADLPATIEVNPKQYRLPEGKLGNYVRLPYAHVDRDRGPHRKMLVDGEIIPLEQFVAFPHVPATVSAMSRLAELAPREPRDNVRFQNVAATVMGTVSETRRVPRTSQQVAAVAAGTARIPQGQRDLTFFTLANYLHGIGMSRSEAEQVMLRVLDTQTDHGSDPFPQSAVIEKIERVFDR